jgi:hypothetical protein
LNFTESSLDIRKWRDRLASPFNKHIPIRELAKSRAGLDAPEAILIFSCQGSLG